MTTELQSLLDTFASRLAVVEGKLGVAAAAGAPPATGGGGGGEAPSIAAFDAYCAAYLDPFVAACGALGAPEAAACGEVVAEGWAAMRAFLVAASQSKKPANFPADCMPLLKPAQEAMAKASKAVGRGDWECHQKTVSEGLQCLSWLVVVPAPRDVIESYIGGQDFWANKIRVKYKKTAPAQTAFCDTFKKLIQELMPYVKAHHMAGVTFNPKGGDLAAFAGAPAPAPKKAAAPAAAPAAAAGGAKAGLGAALAGLQGANDLQSKGLRKVTDDQKTYKKEYAGGAAPAPKAKPKVAARKQTVTKGDPKKTLVGKKWLVENQTKDCGVVTVDLDANEGHKFTIYVVACYEATIVVNGKCNSVTVDACAKCQVVFDSCISSFEVVNSKSMKVQVRGTCPSVAIDKTDGILTYLSKDTLPITSFLTSKSSDMQVSFPDDNDDMVEAPIPEQFQHKACLKDGKPSLTTDVSDLYSH